MNHAKLNFAETQRVEASSDKTKEVIMVWCRKQNATMSQLLQALRSLGRFDVIEDVYDDIVADCLAASEQLSNNQVDMKLITSSRALTIQDVDAVRKGEPLATYDALVLYGDADEDTAFGEYVIERMEAVGLKVFMPMRDLKAGTIEHSASAEIISDRCRKVVAIFSPSFLESNENMFLINFAQSIGIQAGTSKILPIIHKPCNLPPQFTQYHKLPYAPHKEKWVNFWDKLLVKSFGVPNVPEHLTRMDFSWPTQDHLHANSAASMTTYSSSDLYSTHAAVDTVSTTLSTADSLATTVSSIADSEAPLLLPDIPTDEPASETVERKKSKKSPMKKLKGHLSKLTKPST